VVVGRCCMLCGQVGLAGSVTLGDYVVLGGKAGVSDHVSVASKVRVAAKSGVVSNIEEPGDYAGFPAVRAQEWRRSIVALRRLGRPSSQMNTSDLEYRAEDADNKI
jgi:UDP-3-O-[3-hydroxymyristoyl] glucosamine N-acyltransferase